MPVNQRPLAKIVSIPVVLLVAGALLWVGFDRLVWHKNYSTEPAAAVYRQVMGKPVPSGVSKLRVAGRSYFIKHWMWMSFSATPQAIHELTRNRRELDGDKIQMWLRRNYSASNRFDAIDKSAAGWRDVSRLDLKRVYDIGNYHDDIMWNGYLVIDQRNQTVYVHAGD